MDDGDTNPAIRFKDNKFVYPECWILLSGAKWRFESCQLSNSPAGKLTTLFRNRIHSSHF